MSNNTYTQCKLFGHFRVNIQDDMRKYEYIRGDIKGFMTNCQKTEKYVTANSTIITITSPSAQQSLQFRKK